MLFNSISKFGEPNHNITKIKRNFFKFKESHHSHSLVKVMKKKLERSPFRYYYGYKLVTFGVETSKETVERSHGETLYVLKPK